MCMGTCKTATFEISSGQSTWGYLHFIATYEAHARIPILNPYPFAACSQVMQVVYSDFKICFALRGPTHLFSNCRKNMLGARGGNAEGQ